MEVAEVAGDADVCKNRADRLGIDLEMLLQECLALPTRPAALALFADRLRIGNAGTASAYFCACRTGLPVPEVWRQQRSENQSALAKRTAAERWAKLAGPGEAMPATEEQAMTKPRDDAQPRWLAEAKKRADAKGVNLREVTVEALREPYRARACRVLSERVGVASSTSFGTLRRLMELFGFAEPPGWAAAGRIAARPDGREALQRYLNDQEAAEVVAPSEGDRPAVPAPAAVVPPPRPPIERRATPDMQLLLGLGPEQMKFLAHLMTVMDVTPDALLHPDLLAAVASAREALGLLLGWAGKVGT
jgi:hypothetical protein